MRVQHGLARDEGAAVTPCRAPDEGAFMVLISMALEAACRAAPRCRPFESFGMRGGGLVLPFLRGPCGTPLWGGLVVLPFLEGRLWYSPFGGGACGASLFGGVLVVLPFWGGLWCFPLRAYLAACAKVSLRAMSPLQFSAMLSGGGRHMCDEMWPAASL